MAFTHWTASLVFLEKSAGRAALISVLLVVVDVGFAGGGVGLAGGCGDGTVGGGAVVNGVVVVKTGSTLELSPEHPEISVRQILASATQRGVLHPCQVFVLDFRTQR